MNIDIHSGPGSPLFSDAALARRLERAEGHANKSFVEARRVLSPGLGARWTDVGGAWAMFDGAHSPLTQTFGLGLFTAPCEEQLATLEQFFADCSAGVFHEVSTMADPALLPLLASRGYAAVEWSTVLVQRISTVYLAAEGSDITVRRIDRNEADHWADIAAQGWSTDAEVADFVRALGRVSAHSEGTSCFLAEAEGVSLATGSLHLADGVALLAGASTVPAHRRRGAQRALLDARLAFATAQGAELAMMAAAPGSDSQRNAQRAGFSVAYARVKWGRPR